MNLVAGRLLDLGFGYETVFPIVGLLHVIAFGVIMMTVPKIQAVRAPHAAPGADTNRSVP